MVPLTSAAVAPDAVLSWPRMTCETQHEDFKQKSNPMAHCSQRISSGPKKAEAEEVTTGVAGLSEGNLSSTRTNTMMRLEPTSAVGPHLAPLGALFFLRWPQQTVSNHTFDCKHMANSNPKKVSKHKTD